jgi:PIN domain nuclease of toxin-antitoxin system
MNTSTVSNIVDTHTLLWYLQADKKLGTQAKNILQNPKSRLIIPLIVLAEAQIIISKNRTNITSFSDLWQDIKADKRIEIYEITLEIFQRSLQPDAQKVPELHDRLIVSTGLYLQDLGHNVVILTKDTLIVEANVLPIIW